MMVKSIGTSRCSVIIVFMITLIVVVACFVTVGSAQARNSVPTLSSNTNTATAGFFQLSWQTDAERVELQEATSPNFSDPVTLYNGSDLATVISGKPDGDWYYRIRAIEQQPGPWSESVSVTVAHHSLYRALMFLSLGIIVFVAIVMVIIRGPDRAQ